MANAFTPVPPVSFDGEMIFNMSNYVVSDSFKNWVSGMDIVHRDKFILKKTGFETFKHTIHKTSGTLTMVDINISLLNDLPRWLMQQLTQLAKGILSTGMELTFREDWCENFNYKCRWTNAGQFVELGTLLNTGSMSLEAWDWVAI